MTHLLEPTAKSWGGEPLHMGDSIVHRTDSRVRVLLSVAFALTTVLCHTFPPLIAALVLAFGTAMVAKMPSKQTLFRVIAMDSFIIFAIAIMPFTIPGEPLFSLFGFEASREGFHKSFEIVLKANAIVLALLSLVGTMESSTLGHALLSLKMPEKLVHLFLFTVRYIDVMNREYRRLRMAMKARAFKGRSNMHTWRTIGNLFGMLLVRSFDRAERVIQAMKCRGFRGQYHLLDQPAIQKHDIHFAILYCGLIALLPLMEFLV